MKEKLLKIWPYVIPFLGWGTLLFFLLRSCKTENHINDNPRNWSVKEFKVGDSVYIMDIKFDSVYYDPEIVDPPDYR